MTTESNTGFHHEDSLGSISNRHAISFQSAAINSSSEMIPMGGYFAPSPMMLPGNSSVITTSPTLIQPGNSSGSSLLLDSVAGLTHNTGLDDEWSVEEQYILDDSLEKYVVINPSCFLFKAFWRHSVSYCICRCYNSAMLI